MINKVILIGNLGADPEIRTLESGVMVAKLRLATNENYQDKNGEWQTLTEWHDVIMWRSMAERAQASLKKGAQIYVEGKLTHRLWDDQNGNKRKTTEVVANTYRLMGRREDQVNDMSNFPSEESAYASSTGSKPQASPSSSSSNESNAADKKENTEAAAEDDLPF